MRRKVLVAVGVLVLAAVVVLVAMRRQITDAMLFFPERGQARTPDQVGLPYEPLWLTTDDGVRIQSWWIPSVERKLTVVMFHGNAGNMSGRLDNAQMIHQLGASVLLVEYRGYGESDGKPSEEGLYADARAAVAAARKQAAQNKLVVFGRSLGGAVAIDAAFSVAVDGLIAESTFTSLRELSGEVSWIPFSSSLVAYNFSSIKKIGKITVPVLIIHGDADELIPFSMGKRLHRAADKSSRREFHRIVGGQHNGAWQAGGSAYWDAWRAFFAAVEDA